LPAELVRISHQKYRANPLHWSLRGINRFDTPEAPFATLYAAHDVEAALVEVSGDQWRTSRFIQLRDLANYDVCLLRNAGSTKAVNLTGRRLSSLGTDANLFGSTNYSLTQSWALRLMEHPKAPGGIRYHSRKNPLRFCYAIFGRPEIRATVKLERSYPLTDYPYLYRLLLAYDVRVL
jgi:hypothetical protein